MTDPLFLGDLDDPLPEPGERVALVGSEGHHAAAVRRIRVGESVIVADGAGRAVRGPVVEVGRQQVVVEVSEQLQTPERRPRLIVAQALAKGDRSELAVEMLTELGVDEIWPWQSARSIVRWNGERGEKAMHRWRSTVREASKQSRRFRVPAVSAVVDTARLAERIAGVGLALVLHEEAAVSLSALEVDGCDSLLIMVGPEGGISPEELGTLTAAGARAVSISDGVLRTSTAGVVAVAGVLLR